MPTPAPTPAPGPRPRAGAAEPVYQITNAVTPYSDDLDDRVRKYLVSMAVRTVCVVLVIAVHHPVRWVFAVGAVFLPYVAVILANNRGGRRGRVALGTPDVRPTAVGSAPAGDRGPSGRTTSADEPPVILSGVVQPRPDEPRTDAPDPLRDTA